MTIGLDKETTTCSMYLMETNKGKSKKTAGRIPFPATMLEFNGDFRTKRLVYMDRSPH